MAFTESLESVKGTILLNNGSTASGGVRTVSQDMGALNPNAYDIDKIGAIVTAAAPIFDKSVYRMHGVKTYNIAG